MCVETTTSHMTTIMAEKDWKKDLGYCNNDKLSMWLISFDRNLQFSLLGFHHNDLPL